MSKRPRTIWTRTSIAGIPAYDALVNGNRMQVWRVGPGDWQVNLSHGSRSADLGTARTHHEGKRMAVEWANTHPPGSYHWVRIWRLGSRAWAVEDNGNNDRL